MPGYTNKTIVRKLNSLKWWTACHVSTHPASFISREVDMRLFHLITACIVTLSLVCNDALGAPAKNGAFCRVAVSLPACPRARHHDTDRSPTVRLHLFLLRQRRLLYSRAQRPVLSPQRAMRILILSARPVRRQEAHRPCVLQRPRLCEWPLHQQAVRKDCHSWSRMHTRFALRFWILS